MLLFRNLVLEYAKESKNEYSHFLYFREDNSFENHLDINILIHPGSIVTCKYNRFSGMCDKIFFGEPYIFDIIFGTNFISYLQEWIRFGSTNKFDYQTERFYKILLQKNNIKDTIRDFCRNDIRFYKGDIITPSVYSKSRYNIGGRLKLINMRLKKFKIAYIYGVKIKKNKNLNVYNQIEAYIKVKDNYLRNNTL